MKNKTIRIILTLCLFVVLMPASAQSDLQTGIAFERFGKGQNCKMVVLNDATLRGYKLKVYKSLTYKKIGASIAPYLNADRKKARKIREIVDDGKVTSGYKLWYRPWKPLCFCKDNSEEKRQFRFGIAKAALLQRKTYTFTVQKSRFGNVKQ